MPTPPQLLRWWGGGRLKYFVTNWSNIDPDSWVLQIVKHGYRIEFTATPPRRGLMKVTPIPRVPEQRRILEEEIHGLLQKGAIRVAPPSLSKRLYRSSFFLTPKKPNTWRPILNLKPLNKRFIKPKRFRMETLATIIPSCSPGLWATTLDLKDAYLHIPIHQDHQRFLSFRYKHTDFIFQALPFGLSTAPRVFTRVARAVLAFLRQGGITLYAYIDDWLILAESEQECRETTSYVIQTLQNLGWIINFDKSNLQPSQTVTYLGAILDFRRGLAIPTQERISATSKAARNLLKGHTVQARLWLRFRMQAIHETNPILPPPTIQTKSRPPVSTDPVLSRHEAVPAMVVLPLEPVKGKTFLRQQTLYHTVDGRFEHRLGSFLGDSISSGSLVTPRKDFSHQHPRTPCGLKSDRNMVQRTQGDSSFNSVRQLHDCGLSEPPGGNEVPTSLSGNLGSSASLPVTEHFPQGNSSSRRTECPGRRLIEGHFQPQRVDAQPTLGRLRFPHFRPSSRGPLCDPTQLQTPNLLFQASGSASLGDRCSDSRLGRHVGIRLPSLASTTESAAQTSSIQNGNVVDSPILAETTLVSSHSQPSGGSTLPVSERPPSPLTSQGQDSSSRPTVPKANCLEIVNKRLLSKGLSRRSADLAAGARRRSTITTYDSRLEKFFDWAEHHSVDPLEAPVNALCSFFVSLFDEGKQVSTIKNYRSAIPSVHSGFSDGSTVGSNQTILTLLKGMFNKRPPRRRLAPSWSINEVLSSFSSSPYEPIQNSPLDALTKKTIFLVAAASSRRRSEIHALSVKPGFIRFTPDGVHLLPNPSFLAKNQSESFSPDHIFLPSMSTTSSVREDRFICPVRALKWYIEKTKSIRKSDALFLIPRSPYTPASKDTISRWLVEIIAPFAAPDDSPKAHDVRAHASSIAWFRGVPLQDIMRAASWKTPSTFVASYLTNVVSPEALFASSVLRGPASTSTATQDLPPSSRC